MVNYEDNCKVIVSIFWPKKQLLVLAHLNFEIRQQNSYASSCWRYARKYLHPSAGIFWRCFCWRILNFAGVSYFLAQNHASKK